MTVKTRVTPDTITAAIRAGLRDGTFKVGDRLPTERELAEQYGTNRAVVRAGMQPLVKSGLIRATQGSGRFVERLRAAPQR